LWTSTMCKLTKCLLTKTLTTALSLVKELYKMRTTLFLCILTGVICQCTCQCTFGGR